MSPDTPTTHTLFAFFLALKLAWLVESTSGIRQRDLVLLKEAQPKIFLRSVVKIIAVSRANLRVKDLYLSAVWKAEELRNPLSTLARQRRPYFSFSGS